jgi:hypothetical protein
MSKASSRLSIAVPTAAEDKAITAAAKTDPDAQPLTPKQLQSMVPMRALRGRPKSESKKLLVSVRYSLRSWRTSNPRVKVGSRAWMACFASTLHATPEEPESR